MDTSNKLYMLILLVIIVIAAIQIYNYMYRTENMNPALLTHQVEDLSSKPGDPVNVNFFVRDSNRFASDNKLCPKLEQILPKVDGIKCGPQFDWNTYALPGANNVYGDMIWNRTSPRMILEDNSMQCTNNSFNAPQGIPEGIQSTDGSGNISQNLNEFGLIGSSSDQYMMNSPENLEKFVNL